VASWLARDSVAEEQTASRPTGAYPAADRCAATAATGTGVCVAPLLAPNGRLYSPANKSVRATTAPQTPSEKLNRGGNRHGSDRRDRFGALVPHAQPRSVAGPDRVEPRLGVRRVRDLRAVPDCRLCPAPAARCGAIRGDPALCRLHSRDHRLRLGDRRRDRRHHRRLHRPQAHDDAGDPRLFVDDRPQRLRVGLGVLRRLAFSRRGGDRLGMGDRRLDRLRIVARPRPRQGRRHAASGRRARQHSCLLCLAGAHVGQHGGRGWAPLAPAPGATCT
jgi:hypothetical protein